MTYFEVADTDVAARRITGLGGHVCLERTPRTDGSPRWRTRRARSSRSSGRRAAVHDRTVTPGERPPAGRPGRARRAGAGGGHPAAVVAAAQHLVADLRPPASTSPTTTWAPSTTISPADGAGVVRGAGAAPAQGLDLEHLDPVGEFDQALGAGEELGAEVRRDAEGEDVQAQVVDHAGELVDLLRGEELRLVRDDVVAPAALGEVARRRTRTSPCRPRPRPRPSPGRGGRRACPRPRGRRGVKIMPCRPRAERLCSIWRASVDFPQSIVPEKNTSSGMGG